MGNTDLHYLELNEVNKLIQSREVSSVEVTEAILDRISTIDNRLNSYITVTAEHALRQAKKADEEIAAGCIRGPMHGVPIAFKDVCDMEGVATTGAIPIFEHAIADSDSTVVRRFNEAGAVNLGKLNMTEGAYAQHLPPYGAPLNPWNPDVWPGASSSGSGVAQVSGLCYGNVGSDTGGSIRVPSAANGATGLKPTWGRVSRHGMLELAATLDHLGPMCRSAVDAGLMLNVMAGYDTLDPTSSFKPVPDYTADLSTDLSGVRIGVDQLWAIDRVEKETAESVSDAIAVFESLGARTVGLEFPDTTQIIWDWFTVCAPQVALAHRESFPSRKSEYGPVFADQLTKGNEMSAVEYQKALIRRELFTGKVQALFREVDTIVCPAVGCEIPTLEEFEHVDNDMIYDLHSYTCSFTMARNPTITMPSGFSLRGTPLAVQIVAPHFNEQLLIRLGHAFQAETDWHQRRPQSFS